MKNARGQGAIGLLVVLVLLTTGLSAQTILVTSGEHPGFTRVVLQSTMPFDWHRDDNLGMRTVTLDIAERRFDLSRAFRRIGRSRLVDLAAGEGRLTMTLACDCTVRSWSERRGLVVLDIMDTTPEPLAPPAAPLLTAVTPAPGLERHGRAAGMAFAQFWQSREETNAAPATPTAGEAALQVPFLSMAHPTEPDREAILLSVTRQLAGALGQGVLVATAGRGDSTTAALGSGPAGEGTTEAQLRITTVVDRPDLESLALAESIEDTCTDAAVLDFLVDGSGPGFNTGLAGYMQQWIGEFDRVDSQTTLLLARHYLRHGFGAETRALLDRAPAPIDGQSLLTGLGDLLEGRPSNARRHLAGMLDCGGPGAMLAALAGAPARRVASQATTIALAFAQSPPLLRDVLGPDLVRVLIDSGAVDSARVVAETLRRSAPPGLTDLGLIDVMLDRARGDLTRAAARLDSRFDGHPGQDLATLAARLAVAQERDETLSPDVLEQAEVLAGTQRSTAAGRDLMANVIRQWLRRSEPITALASLDRLATWSATIAEDPDRRQLIDDVWHGLADVVDDAELIVLVMTRSDWRDPRLSPATRQALATRLERFDLDLGAGRHGMLLTAGFRDRIGADTIPSGVTASAPDHASAYINPNRQVTAPGVPPVVAQSGRSEHNEASPTGASLSDEVGMLERASTRLAESARLRASLSEIVNR